MWYVYLPEPPKAQVRLADVLITIVLYGLILSLLARSNELSSYHFAVAFCISLGFLTFRIYERLWWERSNKGVVLSHICSALSHFIAFLYLLKYGKMYELNGDFSAVDISAFFLTWLFGFVAVCISGLDVKECLRDGRYVRALYGALGGLPALAEFTWLTLCV